MKTLLFTAALAVACMFGSVANAALLGLNNTGGAGWSVSGTNGAGVGLTPVTLGNNPTWGTLGGGSLWFSTGANMLTASSPLGTYSYTTTFSVASPNVVDLRFRFLNDNSITVTIESLEKGVRPLFTGGNNFSGPPTPVTVAQSDISFIGLNTLRFSVVNEPLPPIAAGSPNPVGLNVQFIAQSADIVPEPSSIALWGGLCGLGLVFRLRRKKQKTC